MENKMQNQTENKHENFSHKIGDAIEHLGEKVSKMGAETLGEKIANMGDKIEHSEDENSEEKASDITPEQKI